MIDIKIIRENPNLVKDNMKKKFLDVKIVDKFLKKDEESTYFWSKWSRQKISGRMNNKYNVYSFTL